MSIRLLFVPGWAMDATLWDPLLAQLPTRVHAIAEPGYFGAERSWPVMHPEPAIAICHSFGVMRVLASPPRDLRGLVSIGGFSRFLRAGDHPNGVAPALLARMRKRLEEDCEATTRAFRLRCGLGPDLPGPVDPEHLRSDFDRLVGGDHRRLLGSLEIPVLAIASRSDPIVPAGLSTSCFANVDWLDIPSHLLPLTAPARCAAAIRSFEAALQ